MTCTEIHSVRNVTISYYNLYPGCFLTKVVSFNLHLLTVFLNLHSGIKLSIILGYTCIFSWLLDIKQFKENAIRLTEKEKSFSGLVITFLARSCLSDVHEKVSA
jgi:hypothetical protein